jgi:hypothetical protein
MIRSPSFPFISLAEAVARARTLYDAVRRNQVSQDVAARHWGYSPKSSGGKQTIAALRAFGLLEGDGAIRVTDRAVHILLSGEEGLLRQAALAPPLYARLWERYRSDLPSDQGLRTHLVAEMGFNENAVADVIRGYRETLDFAKLREPAAARASAESPPAPLPPSDLTLRFPLLDGNRGELRVLRKIAPEEADQIRTLFEIWLQKIVDRS